MAEVRAGGRALIPKNAFGWPSIRAKALSRDTCFLDALSTALLSEKVEDQSSETLTVNQLSAARLQVVPPTIDTA
jgi:hypothetical protein